MVNAGGGYGYGFGGIGAFGLGLAYGGLFFGPFWAMPFLLRPWYLCPPWYYPWYVASPPPPWWSPPPPPITAPGQPQTATHSELWPVAVFDVARAHLCESHLDSVGEVDGVFSASCVVDRQLITLKVWDVALRDGFLSHQPGDFRSLAAAIVTFRYDDASSFSAAQRWLKMAQAMGEQEAAAYRSFTLVLIALKSTSGASQEVDIEVGSLY